MKTLNKSTVAKQVHPVKILQYGEGNFLRAFFDWMIEESNRKGITDASVAVVSPRFKSNATIENLSKQDGLYHVCLEGIENGKPKQSISLITCVADAFSPLVDPDRYVSYITSPELEFVVSNTTEAGISFMEEDASSLSAVSFPAKITAMLYHRFSHFNGDPSKGLIILCCELVENNGQLLREYVLRHVKGSNLGEDFERWVDESCIFCDTLVDRIVSGFPHDSIGNINESTGYEDSLVVKGELFHLWVIGGKNVDKVKEKLPLQAAGLNVHFLPSVKEFRDKKVRVLNGSHTGMVAIALQLGCETVLDAFTHKKVNSFINNMVETEVLPQIEGDREELKLFADSILERFFNPYIRHLLRSISLNSLSKWETRNFPTVKDMWLKNKQLAEYELFSFAALLTLYAPDSGFNPEDNEAHVKFIRENWNPDDLSSTVSAIVEAGIFTENFEKTVPGFCRKAAEYVTMISNEGMEKALESFLSTH